MEGTKVTEGKQIITQDVKALINSLGVGRVQINVIQNVTTGVAGATSGVADLYDMLAKIPGNRVDFIKDCLVDMVDKRFNSEDVRAHWLGISRRLLRTWRKERNARADPYWKQFRDEPRVEQITDGSRTETE